MDVSVKTAFSWLRTGSCAGLLWTG